MEKKLTAPHIYTPKNMVGLLNLYRKMPQGLIYAGGTGILWNQRFRELNLPGDIISLEGVSELNFISRTESFLEIGAAAPFNRILGIGRHVLAPAFYEGLEQIANPVVRNYATLGGNLARRESWMDIVPILLLMDVKLELRRAGGSHWVPMAKFLERLPLFREGELITRLRIPLDEWNAQLYRKFPAHFYGPENRITVVALGKIHKGFINHARFCLGAHGETIIRNRELENTVEGKKLPLSQKEMDPALELLDQTLEKVRPSLTSVQKNLARRTIRWFLYRTVNEDPTQRPWHRRA